MASFIINTRESSRRRAEIRRCAQESVQSKQAERERTQPLSNCTTRGPISGVSRQQPTFSRPPASLNAGDCVNKLCAPATFLVRTTRSLFRFAHQVLHTSLCALEIKPGQSLTLWCRLNKNCYTLSKEIVVCCVPLKKFFCHSFTRTIFV
jgi:hypothetical protein